MITLIWILILITAIFVLSYHRASRAVYSIAISVLLLLLSVLTEPPLKILVVIWIVWIVIGLIINILPLRRGLISRPLMKLYQKHLPKFSLTEQAVLYAGNVGWEAELMSGMPDWDQLQALPWVKLSSEEQAFLEGPVADL